MTNKPASTKLSFTKKAYTIGTPRRQSAAPGHIFFCIMSTFCFALILRNTDAAIEYMGRGLKICASTLIPSLFPFMIISELLVESGVGASLGKLFAKPMRWIFGLSGAGCSAVFLGSLCGFPIGAKTAVSLYDRNIISKIELEHLLTFSNNPSSAFIISAVGISLFSSKRLGVIMYCVILFSGFFIGFISRFFLHVKDNTDQHKHFPTGLYNCGIEIFTGAVSHSVTSMLTVCAYVVFFSAISGTLSCMISDMASFPSIFKSILFGILEMSSGVSYAAKYSNQNISIILAVAIASWSGLSVHFQIMTICSGRTISFKPYIIAKMFQALLSACIMGILLRFLPDKWLLLSPNTAIESTFFSLSGMLDSLSLPAVITNTIFLGTHFVSSIKKLCSNLS